MQSNIRGVIIRTLSGVLFLLFATQGFAQPPQAQPSDDFWRAWAVTGERESQIVVEGIYDQGGFGIVATLEEAAAIGDTTQVLLLKLTTETLPGNWPLISRPIPVRYESKSYQSEQFSSIRIRYPSGKDVTINQVTEIKRADFVDPPDPPAEPLLVTKIQQVDLKIETTAPPNLVIEVSGEVPTGGFRNPKLIRAKYVTPPEDGIQDFYLHATPPSGPATQVISEVKATHLWEGFSEEAPWLKGIRIHGTGEGVVVKKLQ